MNICDVYVLMSVCMFMWEFRCVCHNIHESQSRGQPCVCFSISASLRQGNCRPQWSACSFPPQAWGDLNSSPLTCVANTDPLRQLPSPRLLLTPRSQDSQKYQTLRSFTLLFFFRTLSLAKWDLDWSPSLRRVSRKCLLFRKQMKRVDWNQRHGWCHLAMSGSPAAAMSVLYRLYHSRMITLGHMETGAARSYTSWPEGPSPFLPMKSRVWCIAALWSSRV